VGDEEEVRWGLSEEEGGGREEEGLSESAVDVSISGGEREEDSDSLKV
jgi:hypothetical protein